jgi:hypothetical protein
LEIEYRVGKDELIHFSSAGIKELSCLREKPKSAHFAQCIAKAKLQKVSHR